MKNIIETAIDARTFKILITAIQAADLIDVLSESGPITAFAPNDDAFLMLAHGTIDELVKSKDKVTAFLADHIALGKVMAADLERMGSAKTILGRTLTITATSRVKVNNATIIQPDVECTNGVIHVIDSVIMRRDDETGHQS